MSMLAIIIMWVCFIAILILALNRGDMDKEGDGRTKFWEKFEGK